MENPALLPFRLVSRADDLGNTLQEAAGAVIAMSRELPAGLSRIEAGLAGLSEQMREGVAEPITQTNESIDRVDARIASLAEEMSSMQDDMEATRKNVEELNGTTKDLLERAPVPDGRGPIERAKDALPGLD